MSDPIALSEMPTLTLLYKLQRIGPEDYSSGGTHAPNSAYNDKISLIRADITALAIDAIVNAANKSLLGGGGVDGAIHRAAGPQLLEECGTLDGCPTGSAKITNGYELPSKKVIHAVGPIYWVTKQEGTHAQLLGGCYRRALELAVENDCKSIAFSALSTGIYGYPSGEASHVALRTVRQFFDEGKGEGLERVVFCNFMQKDEDAYYRNVPKYFPPVVAESAKSEETEKVETAETTEKIDGAASDKPAATSDSAELDAKLPDPPTALPTNAEEPSAKKQKTEATKAEATTEDTEDDYVVIDKEEADGHDEKAAKA